MTKLKQSEFDVPFSRENSLCTGGASWTVRHSSCGLWGKKKFYRALEEAREKRHDRLEGWAFSPKASPIFQGQVKQLKLSWRTVIGMLGQLNRCFLQVDLLLGLWCGQATRVASILWILLSFIDLSCQTWCSIRPQPGLLLGSAPQSLGSLCYLKPTSHFIMDKPLLWPPVRAKHPTCPQPWSQEARVIPPPLLRGALPPTALIILVYLVLFLNFSIYGTSLMLQLLKG